MTSLDEARSLSKKLKDEATNLLIDTGLYELLSNYGTVELGGSYKYGLLVDRDLDFGVAIKEMTPQLRSVIVATFAKQAWTYSINMTDRINFEPLSNLQAPRGLYLGLTIPYPHERWNIDVWFTLGESVRTDELAEKMFKASQEQKDVMLQIKYDLMMSGQKQKGITSVQVYEAVLDNGIKSTLEFKKLFDY